MTVPQVFARWALTGGATGALDAIDGGRLADGDMTFVMSSGGILYPYRVNATSGAAEASPVTISPDTNAGNKRHILAAIAAAGIVFPATQIASAGANTLDDYEEGTWDPTLLFGGAAVGLTYSSRTGYYTKLGRVAFYSLNFTLSAKGSSTGQATISLPFPVGPGTQGNAAIIAGIANLTFTSPLMPTASNGAGAILTLYDNNAGAIRSITHTAFTDTSTLRLCGFINV